MFATLMRCLRLESPSISSCYMLRHPLRFFHSNGPVFSPRVPPGKPLKLSTDNDVREGSLAISSKYKIFDDADSTIIVNTAEEKFENDEEEVFDEFAGINLKRGLSGVFDIEELVEVLRRENALNIFVVAVHPNCKFVEHICIVTCRGYRHMQAIIEFVRRVFKKKRNPTDIVPIIEGKTSNDWQALDLGNIALHVFMPEARKQYDLEQLWAVGQEFDSISQAPENDIIKLLEKHSRYLIDFEPIDESEEPNIKDKK